MSGKHRDVFARACLECHSAERQEGGMRLDDLPLALDSVESADRWRRVLDQLNSGSMPPDDAKPLDPQDKIAVLDELSVSLAAARRLLADGGGRVPLRRLNRREYGRTIWELLGVGLDTRSLPADESAEGFDTAGGMLFMSGEQMLRYQELGREAVAAALKQAVAIRSPQKTHHEAEEKTKEILGHMRETIDLHRRNKARMSAVDQAAAAPAVAKQAQELRSKAGDNWWEFYWHWMEFPGAPTPQSYGFKDAYDAYLEDRLWETITIQGATYLTQPAVDTGAYLGLHTNVRSCYQRALIPRHLSPGTYTIRIRLGATEAAPPDRRFLEFLASATSAADGHSHISAHHVTGTVAEPDTIEIFIRKTKESSESFEVMENRVDSGDGRRFYESEFKRNGVGPDFAIWIDWIEVEGPVVTPENEVAIRWVGGLHDRLLTIAQAEAFDTAVERPVVCEVLEAFARKACRGHQPTAVFLDKLVALYETDRQAGQRPLDAIVEPLAAVLASPRFLYLHEPATGETPELLADNELATRLAMLLWSGPPDDRLLELAAAGRLRDPAVLSSEVDRMIADRRTSGFATAFVHQWLGLSRLDFFQFSQERFPRFDVSTKDSARREPIETFLHLLRSGGSLERLLASDTVVVDALLAMYYGLDGVKGDAFREVPLPAGSHRGGLLGMAAILAMGSDGTNTSPVERGAWVLRKLLDDPPPPAPANVPELKRIATGLSARERLRLHQEQPQCAQCHRKIDPVGFGLENFDAVGRLREIDDRAGLPAEKAAIDPAGQIWGGPSFTTFEDLQGIIAAKREPFSRGFSKALIAYALGRPSSFADEQLVADMVSKSAADGYSIRSIVQSLVASRAFQTK
jgi:hypothetical protein